MKETEDTSGSNALYMDPPDAMRMLAWPCPQGEGHTAWVQQSHVKEKILRTIADIGRDTRQDKGIMFLSPEPLLQLRRSLNLPPNTPDPSLGLQIAAVAMNVCGRVSLYGAPRRSALLRSALRCSAVAGRAVALLMGGKPPRLFLRVFPCAHWKGTCRPIALPLQGSTARATLTTTGTRKTLPTPCTRSRRARSHPLRAPPLSRVFPPFLPLSPFRSDLPALGLRPSARAAAMLLTGVCSDPDRARA